MQNVYKKWGDLKSIGRNVVDEDGSNLNCYVDVDVGMSCCPKLLPMMSTLLCICVLDTQIACVLAWSPLVMVSRVVQRFRVRKRRVTRYSKIM